MTDEQLIARLQVLVRSERKITLEVLQLIQEGEKRMLYTERAYPSMFEWLVRFFGYSHSAAYRRLQAARLLKQVPEVAGKLDSGQMNLSSVARLQQVLHKEEKSNHHRLNRQEILSVVQQIEGKSTEEADRVLARLFPASVEIRKEKKYALSEELVCLVAHVERATMNDLETVRNLLSHTMIDASWGQIIGRLAQEFLKRKDPLRSTHRAAASAARCVAPQA